MSYYINFKFINLSYDGNSFCGCFISEDLDIVCDFIYDRKTQKYEIWNNNKSVDEILPLPIWWLEKKLLENGKLKDKECRICY